MMSLEVIRNMSREAGIAAAERRETPLIIETDDMLDIGTFRDTIHGIPFLGDHLPEGWARVDLSEIEELNGHPKIYTGDNDGYGAFFVDSTGLGYEEEASMTIRELYGAIIPGYGYGIVETGQFQVKIGMFRRV